MIANVAVNRDALLAPTPDPRNMKAPVMLLLGACTYIPRGLAMEYFGVYKITRSQLIPHVGHILWATRKATQ